MSAETHRDDASTNQPDYSFKGPWFSSREAVAYIPVKNLRSLYGWCRRRGIVRRANGSIAKADLDRALDPKRKPRRRMASASLANLRPRRTA